MFVPSFCRQVCRHPESFVLQAFAAILNLLSLSFCRHPERSEGSRESNLTPSFHIFPTTISNLLLSSPPPKNRHFDRSCSQFHREQRSGEIRFSTETAPQPMPLPFAFCLCLCRCLLVVILRRRRRIRFSSSSFRRGQKAALPRTSNSATAQVQQRTAVSQQLKF
jgi:hypothetical protein